MIEYQQIMKTNISIIFFTPQMYGYSFNFAGISA